MRKKALSWILTVVMVVSLFYSNACHSKRC